VAECFLHLVNLLFWHLLWLHSFSSVPPLPPALLLHLVTLVVPLFLSSPFNKLSLDYYKAKKVTKDLNTHSIQFATKLSKPRESWVPTNKMQLGWEGFYLGIPLTFTGKFCHVLFVSSTLCHKCNAVLCFNFQSALVSNLWFVYKGFYLVQHLSPSGLCP